MACIFLKLGDILSTPNISLNPNLISLNQNQSLTSIPHSLNSIFTSTHNFLKCRGLVQSPLPRSKSPPLPHRRPPLLPPPPPPPPLPLLHPRLTLPSDSPPPSLSSSPLGALRPKALFGDPRLLLSETRRRLRRRLLLSLLLRRNRLRLRRLLLRNRIM